MNDLSASTYPFLTANNPHTPCQVGVHSFTYDANGNMLKGLHGKTMNNDRESHPVSVSYLGGEPSYGLHGKGLIWHVTSTVTTLFTGVIETRNYGTESKRCATSERLS